MPDSYVTYVDKPATFTAAASGTAMAGTQVTELVPGNTVLICVSTNGAASDTCTIVDNSTQPGDPNVYVLLNDFGANFGGNVHIYSFMCFVTRRVLTTDTITGTLSVGASRRCWCAHQFTGWKYPIATVRSIVGGAANGTFTQSPDIFTKSVKHFVGAGNQDSPYTTQALYAFFLAENTGNLDQLVCSGWTKAGFIATNGGSVDKQAQIAYVIESTNTPSPHAFAGSDAAAVGWLGYCTTIEEGFGYSTVLNPTRRAFQSA